MALQTLQVVIYIYLTIRTATAFAVYTLGAQTDGLLPILFGFGIGVVLNDLVREGISLNG